MILTAALLNIVSLSKGIYCEDDCHTGVHTIEQSEKHDDHHDSINLTKITKADSHTEHTDTSNSEGCDNCSHLCNHIGHCSKILFSKNEFVTHRIFLSKSDNFQYNHLKLKNVSITVYRPPIIFS